MEDIKETTQTPTQIQSSWHYLVYGQVQQFGSFIHLSLTAWQESTPCPRDFVSRKYVILRFSRGGEIKPEQTLSYKILHVYNFILCNAFNKLPRLSFLCYVLEKYVQLRIFQFNGTAVQYIQICNIPCKPSSASSHDRSHPFESSAPCVQTLSSSSL